MDDASIRDFNGGIEGHVASALEQTLFFFKLITTRHMHIYFLFGMMLIPFFRFKAIQNTFKLEEITNSCYQ